MQTEPLYEWPGRAKTIVKKAHASGWTTRVTWAEGPPQNVCVRFFRNDAAPVYAIWLGTTWGWARTRSGASLKQGELLAYLENPHGLDTDSARESGGVESTDAGSEAIR